MGRVIMIGAAILVALIFLPGLLKGGSGEAQNAGGKAADSAVDAVKDPQAVVDKVDKATEPVIEVATPWYEYLVAQPWFYAFVAAGVFAWLGRRWWLNMGATAQKITIAAGVALLFFLFIAFGGTR